MLGKSEPARTSMNEAGRGPVSGAFLGMRTAEEIPSKTEKVAVCTCAGALTAGKIRHIRARGRLARDMFQVRFVVREVAMMRDLGRWMFSLDAKAEAVGSSSGQFPEGYWIR